MLIMNKTEYKLNDIELFELKPLIELAKEIEKNKIITEKQIDEVEYLSSSFLVLAKHAINHIANREHMILK